MKEKDEKKVIRMSERKEPEKRKIHIPVKRILIGLILCLILAIGGIAAFCPIKTIRIADVEDYTKAEVKQAVKKKGYVSNTVAYFLLSKIKQPELLPFIESYDVEINGPNTVTIHINEKKRAGCLLYNGKYVYFDKNGYALESSQKKFDDVPLVTGLKFEKLVMQEKIPVKKKNVFSFILELATTIGKYNIPIDQIYMEDDGTALLISGDITVDLCDNENIDIKIPELAGILKKLKGKSGTVDMRYFDEYQKITVFQPKNS